MKLLRYLSMHDHTVDILAQERVEGRLDDRGVAATCHRLNIQIVPPADLRGRDDVPGALHRAGATSPAAVRHGR